MEDVIANNCSPITFHYERAKKKFHVSSHDQRQIHRDGAKISQLAPQVGMHYIIDLCEMSSGASPIRPIKDFAEDKKPQVSHG